jgi:hypothetical protein
VPRRPKPDWLDAFNEEADRRMDAIGVFEVDSYPEWPSGTITTFGPEIEEPPPPEPAGDDEPDAQ